MIVVLAAGVEHDEEVFALSVDARDVRCEILQSKMGDLMSDFGLTGSIVLFHNFCSSDSGYRFL